MPRRSRTASATRPRRARACSIPCAPPCPRTGARADRESPDRALPVAPGRRHRLLRVVLPGAVPHRAAATRTSPAAVEDHRRTRAGTAQRRTHLDAHAACAAFLATAPAGAAAGCGDHPLVPHLAGDALAGVDVLVRRHVPAVESALTRSLQRCVPENA